LKPETTALICQRLLRSRPFARGLAIAGVGAVALVVAGRVASRARVDRLCEGVDRLNEKIGHYLESGGCLDGLRGVEAILEVLKEAGIGLGRQADVCLQTELQAASGEPRAVWDPRVQRLVMRVDGAAGAREFFLCAGRDSQVAA
jgi:hypothetical protein